MKTVQQLDENGFHTGQTTAEKDPLEPMHWLMPKGSIDAAAPPPLASNQRAKWTGTDWEVQDMPAPPPPPPPPTAAEIRRGEITARLYQIDTDSARPSRNVALAMAAGQVPQAFDVSKLKALETEAAALRMELAGLA